MAEASSASPDPAPPRLSPPRRWLIDLPLQAKSRLVFVSLMLLFAAVCTVFLYAQRRAADAQRRTMQTYEVLALVESVEVQALGLRRVLREGLAAPGDAAIDAYEAQRGDFDRLLLQLRLLTRGNPSQAPRLDQIDRLLAEWGESFVRPATSVVRSDPEPGRRQTHPQFLAVLTGGSEPLNRLQRVLADVRDEERRLLAGRVQRLDRDTGLGSRIAVGALLMGLFAGLYLLVGTRRLMAEPLQELTALLPRVSKGETDLRIPYGWRRDEVGRFAQALMELRELVAHERGQSWVKEQLAEIAAALQLAATHESFGHELLRRLCPILQAGYGLAYRWNEDTGHLQACAGYAVPPAALASARFRLGQGMVGQCVVERRILTMTSVPPEHFRIVSGLGSTVPGIIAFAPLISRGETVGALEVAMLRPLAGWQAQLLDEVLSPSALAWQTLARSIRTQELLATTRVQAEQLEQSAEALQSQQEELRTANEALRARTQLLEEQGQRLQASEEELRAQAEELRLANEALRESAETLTQRQHDLENARAELERRAERLETASRYKSEFLANMSHELRTPLNSLLILARSLADNEEGNLSADQIESARIIHDSGRNLLQLINDILDLSKVEAGKMTLTVEDVNLADFAVMQERQFRHVAQARGLSFEVVVEPEAPALIRSDGTRIGQIVANLLSNAFKFTSAGGVTLRIGRPGGRVQPRLPGLGPDNAVYFAVTDTGIGIPADKLELVFQAFEQADMSTSRRFGGTGLGLSIVRSMAVLLGGEVQVLSEEGKGSSFTLILPQALAVDERSVPPSLPSARESAAPVFTPPEDHETTKSSPAGSGEEAPLLIVEDDANFASILAALAARRQVRTLVTSRGRTALRIAREQPLRGILLDLGLPDISGWEVLQALKADARTRGIPVHVISAEGSVADRSTALGAVGHLVKPVTKEAVFEAMERVMHAAPAGRRRVLLVDDDPGSRKSVHQLLEHDAEIVEAADAAAARAALESQHFDCLILDLGLPGVSGFELLEQLAPRGALPPVVIYSARELTDEETLRLREYTESIVIKGARSPERLLEEVSLFIHATRPKPGRPPPAPSEPVQDMAGKHVLVVDDDMRNVFALSRALRARQLRVSVAQDGNKALAQLEAHADIDLILMDVMMPGMDGYETMRRIRARPQWSAIPIIAVTAKAMAGDREKCLEAGANDYCSKPIDIDRLLSQIRVWV